MSEDIVNRLNCEAQNCILYNHGDAQLAIEAANEIERLREVIKELETEKNRLERLTYG